MSTKRDTRLTGPLLRALTSCLLLALSASLLLAANDPGHDTLYLEEQGAQNLSGSMNISEWLRVADLIYSQNLRVLGNGSTPATSIPHLYALDTNNLYLGATQGIYLGQDAGSWVNVRTSSGLNVSQEIHATGDIYTAGSLVQKRVTGSCGAGEAIQAVNADGTVSCQSTSGASSGGGWTNTSTTTSTSLDVNVTNAYPNMTLYNTGQNTYLRFSETTSSGNYPRGMIKLGTASSITNVMLGIAPDAAEAKKTTLYVSNAGGNYTFVQSDTDKLVIGTSASGGGASGLPLWFTTQGLSPSTPAIHISSGGGQRVSVGHNTTEAQLDVQARNNAYKGIVVRAFSTSQSANLQEWYNGANNGVYVDEDAHFWHAYNFRSYFRDSDISIYSPADGQLSITSDSLINITTGTLYYNNNEVCTASNGLCNSAGDGTGGWTNTSTTTSTSLDVNITTGSLIVAGTITGSNFNTASGTRGTYVGVGTGDSYADVVAVGWDAASGNGNNEVTAIGSYAGVDNQGLGATFIGYYAGYENSDHYMTALGRYAGYSHNSAGSTHGRGVLVGNTAGYDATTYQTVAVGHSAADSATTINSTFIGHESGNGASGNRLVGLGNEALEGNTGNDVIAIGHQAGKSNTQSNKFFVQQANINSVPLINGSFDTGSFKVNGSEVCTASNGLCSGSVSASGTDGTLAKFNSSGGLEDSLISESGSTVTIDGNITIPHDRFRIGQATSSATNTSTVAIGHNADATGEYATALGTIVTASGEDSVAIGRSSTASGSESIAIGNFATAAGTGSLGMAGGDASNNYDIAIGGAAAASGGSAIAVGVNSQATIQSIGIGVNAVGEGRYGGAFGYKANTSHEDSYAIGNEAKTTAVDQLMIGSSGHNLNTYIHGALETTGAATFGAASTVAGSSICTPANGLCNQTNTQLSEGEVEGYIYDNDNALGAAWTVTSSGSYDINFDSNTFAVDTSENRAGIRTNTPGAVLDINSGTLESGEEAIEVTGTLANPGSTTETGIAVDFDTSGSANSKLIGLSINLGPDFTGNRANYAVIATTEAKGTQNSIPYQGNFGSRGRAIGNTTGYNYGIHGEAYYGTVNVGAFGVSDQAKASATNIGVVGFGYNTGTSATQIGGYFGLESTTPSFTSAALIADNGAVSAPIFLARDNGGEVFRIDDGGQVGVKTNNPTAALQIKQSTTDIIGSDESTTGVAIGEVGGSQLRLVFNNESNYSIIHSVNTGTGDLPLVLDATSVGIGTNNPSEKLEVSDGSTSITFSPAEPLINTTNGKNLTMDSAGGYVIINIG